MIDFPIPDNIIKVLSILEENGYEAFVVGGCVRDLCRGVIPHDYDVTTSALPEETKACFSDHRVIETGIKHGTVTVMSDGDPVEITTYRTDGEYVDNRHPKEVIFTSDLELDVSRRDFTVNAMAYSPKRGIFDIFGGREDIERRIIKCVGDADTRFNEDGLRILRALRFASTLGFEIEEKTSDSIHRNKHLLKNISAERIYSEISKLILGIGAEWVLLSYFDVIKLVFPSLSETKDAEYEAKVKALAGAECDLHLRLAMLLGRQGAGDVKRLKADGEAIKNVRDIAEISEISIKSKTEMRRLRRRYSGEIIKRSLLYKLHSGSAPAGGVSAETDSAEMIFPKKVSRETFEFEMSLLYATENDPVTPKMLEITGEDVKALGVPPGRAVGDALEYLLELVITDKIKNDRESLLRAAGDYIQKLK